MSSFTRTGLIPAITNSSMRSQCQQEIPKHQHLNLILPASFSFRPFSRDHPYINPYPNTCSIMCNHPIVDGTTKKLLHETKEKLRKGQVLNKDMRLNYFDDDDDDDDNFLTGTREHIIVPEILFRRYTETDSRPLTPTSINLCHSYRFSKTKQESNFTSRRCITPDDKHLSKAPERKRLVLDLRKCLSQSSLTLKGKQVEGQREYYSVMSTTAIISKTVHGVGDRKKKPLLSSEITKYKYFSRKNCHQESTKNVSLKKNNSLYPQHVEANLQGRSGKLKKHKKARKQRSEKKRQKKIDSNNIIRDFNENLETEMARDVTGENNLCVDQNDDSSEKAGNLIHSSTESGSSVDEHSSDKCDIDKERIRVLLKDIDSDTFQKDVGVDKYKRFLRGNMLGSGNDHTIDVNGLIEKYEWEIFEKRKKGSSSSVYLVSEVETTNLPEIPLPPQSELCRIISRRNARFTLPSDKTILEGMQPLEYLQRHVHVSDTCRNVYNRIFQMYASKMENNPDSHDAEPVSCLSAPSNLNSALRCAMGKNFRTEEWTDFLQLLALNVEYAKINLCTWHGICALCERRYGHILTLEYLTRNEDPCYEIELADFEFLDQKLINLDITIELKKILVVIRDS